MGEGAHIPSRPGVFIAVALLSAGVLGYEILLARLLAIVHWHHFAYMIIAVALLGFGAAGSLVAVLQRPLLRHFRWTFGGAALGFGAGAPLAFALAQWLPFNALEIAWDRAQLAWLFALYLVLSLPFLSAALALALAFRANAARAGALYRMDLMGAGFGALGMVFLLDALPLADALRVVGVVGAASGGIVLLWGRARRLARGGALLAVCAGLALPAALPDHWLRPQPSPYKGLSLALTAPDARIVAERHGPLGWLAAVESPTVPFRHAPGLSLMAPVGPPAPNRPLHGRRRAHGDHSCRCRPALSGRRDRRAPLPHVGEPAAGAGAGRRRRGGGAAGAAPRRTRGRCGGAEPGRARHRA